MRKIINGRTYNTETSKEIGYWFNGLYSNNMGYCCETLYRNTKGAYFIHGEGGAQSKYSAPAGDMRGPGEGIVPLTDEEAREWAEKHLDADEYEAEFGEPDEAEPTSDLVNRERVNMTLSNETITLLRRLSAETGVPVSRMVDKAVAKVYGE